jgi:hypothetical protein
MKAKNKRHANAKSNCLIMPHYDRFATPSSSEKVYYVLKLLNVPGFGNAKVKKY